MAKPNTTHCQKGHSYAEFGRYKSNNQCKECKRLNNLAMAKRTGGWRKPGQHQRRRSGHQKLSDTAKDAIRTNRILALHEELEKATTPWEREDIRAEIAAAQAQL